MSKTVICRAIPKSGAGTVILEIQSASGDMRRAVISKSQDFKLQYGDLIKCAAGTAAILVNPGTAAVAFLLQYQPPKAGSNFRSELEINDEVTRIIQRGKVFVANDIGSINQSPAATTR